MTKQHLPERQIMEHKQSFKITEEDMMTTILEYILTQYNLKQGLERYGKREEQATKKGLVQIHNMNALKPLDVKKLIF